jgi:XTP/dITP diphosphohydrolase
MASHLALENLIATMATLRGEDGCPWDQEQTHQSLVGYLLEEVFELIEALESGNLDDIREELGDVLYQVLFHADIAAAHPSDPFTIDDVAATVDQKMRDRHPHVFSDGNATTIDEVKARWAEIKAVQKSHRTSVLEGIPAQLSALARAESVIKRAGEVCDSPPWEPVAPLDTEEQLGEYLLGLVGYAKEHNLDAEKALRQATRNFEGQVNAQEVKARGTAHAEPPPA